MSIFSELCDFLCAPSCHTLAPVQVYTTLALTGAACGLLNTLTAAKKDVDFSQPSNCFHALIHSETLCKIALVAVTGVVSVILVVSPFYFKVPDFRVNNLATIVFLLLHMGIAVVANMLLARICYARKARVSPGTITAEIIQGGRQREA